MNLATIALQNLRRRTTKAAFLLVGLMTGVTAVVSLAGIVGTMSRDLEEKLDRFGANILISPRTEGLSLTYGGLSLGGVSYAAKELSADDLASISTIPNSGNIKVVAPKTMGVVTANGRQVLLAGVDSASELELKKWWKLRGRLPQAPDEIAAGHRAALNMRLGEESYVTINDTPFSVVGVLEETGSADDELLFATIPAAQKLLGKEGLFSLVEVSALCKDCPVSDMVSQIAEKLPNARVTAVQQVVNAKMQAIDQLRKLSAGVSAAVLLVGALMVLVTMMGSVRERTREIGIFRAIGFRRRHIVEIILLEATIVSTLAGILGCLAGLGIARLALPAFMEGSGSLVVSPWLPPSAVFLALVIGLLASAWPALAATRLAPGEALKILQ